MTRLTKSSSLGGATPTVRPSQSRAPVNQLLGSATETSGVQVSGPLKTTTSPGRASPNQYGTLLTRTRSPVHPGQPCRVCSMEPDGMKKACTKKVLTTNARTKATRSSTGSSRRSDPFFLLWRPPRRCEVGAAGVSVASPSRVIGRSNSWPSSSPGTTSAGPPGRWLLIRSKPTAQRTRRRHRRSEPAFSVSAHDRGPLRLDLGGLAAQLTEVVQLRATHVTAGHDLDLLDDRGVHREGALDADTEADLADGEGLADPPALPADDHTLEDLDAGAVALDDPHVHLHGVARPERGDVVAQRIGVEYVQGVHRGSPVLAVMSLRCGQQAPPAVRSGELRSGEELGVDEAMHPQQLSTVPHLQPTKRGGPVHGPADSSGSRSARFRGAKVSALAATSSALHQRCGSAPSSSSSVRPLASTSCTTSRSTKKVSRESIRTPANNG